MSTSFGSEFLSTEGKFYTNFIYPAPRGLVEAGFLKKRKTATITHRATTLAHRHCVHKVQRQLIANDDLNYWALPTSGIHQWLLMLVNINFIKTITVFFFPLERHFEQKQWMTSQNISCIQIIKRETVLLQSQKHLQEWWKQKKKEAKTTKCNKTCDDITDDFSQKSEQ